MSVHILLWETRKSAGNGQVVVKAAIYNDCMSVLSAFLLSFLHFQFLVTLMLCLSVKAVGRSRMQASLVKLYRGNTNDSRLMQLDSHWSMAYRLSRLHTTTQKPLAQLSMQHGRYSPTSVLDSQAMPYIGSLW